MNYFNFLLVHFLLLRLLNFHFAVASEVVVNTYAADWIGGAVIVTVGVSPRCLLLLCAIEVLDSSRDVGIAARPFYPYTASWYILQVSFRWKLVTIIITMAWQCFALVAPVLLQLTPTTGSRDAVGDHCYTYFAAFVVHGFAAFDAVVERVIALEKLYLFGRETGHCFVELERECGQIEEPYLLELLLQTGCWCSIGAVGTAIGSRFADGFSDLIVDVASVDFPV